MSEKDPRQQVIRSGDITITSDAPFICRRCKRPVESGLIACSCFAEMPCFAGAPSGKRLNVLVLCEFSGKVRDAFRALGHNAISNDLLPCDWTNPGPHIQGDCRLLDYAGVDLVIAHPPCTHLAVSGARWFKNKQKEQAEALDFVRWIMALPVSKIALENPVSIISSRIRRPDQIVQPWMFGHGETKATCLWLKNLPKLLPTDVVDGREPRVHYESPGPDRWKRRSMTLDGIAAAMAEQWGGKVTA